MLEPGVTIGAAEIGLLATLGLSQVLSPGMTLTGMGSMASVEFNDPTLLHGDPPSRATDIWSLAVTLHRALTGHGLYGELPDNDPVLVLRKVLSTPPAVSDELDGPAAELIRAAISPDLSARPATALEFAERVEALAAWSVTHPRSSRRDRARSRAARRPGPG